LKQRHQGVDQGQASVVREIGKPANRPYTGAWSAIDDRLFCAVPRQSR
jgi:hypothetical protein